MWLGWAGRMCAEALSQARIMKTDISGPLKELNLQALPTSDHLTRRKVDSDVRLQQRTSGRRKTAGGGSGKSGMVL